MIPSLTLISSTLNPPWNQMASYFKLSDALCPLVTAPAGPKRPTLALVIPTKDKLEHLRQTLPTNASLGFDEIIVIDSSTKDKEGVEGLCKKSAVKYVFEKLDRLGARNRGAELASTEWVAISDDDIIFKRFDLSKFSELARNADFMRGGWGAKPGENYAWIFRRDFFLNTLKGYDPLITGGDDLDITLRAQKLGKEVYVFGSGLYESEAIGLGIAKDYPEKWIRNKALYALTCFPLMRRHPFLIKGFLMRDLWRARRMTKGEPVARILFESFIDRAGAIYSPAYYLLKRPRAES